MIGAFKFALHKTITHSWCAGTRKSKPREMKAFHILPRTGFIFNFSRHETDCRNVQGYFVAAFFLVCVCNSFVANAVWWFFLCLSFALKRARSLENPHQSLRIDLMFINFNCCYKAWKLHINRFFSRLMQIAAVDTVKLTTSCVYVACSVAVNEQHRGHFHRKSKCKNRERDWTARQSTV